MMMSSTALPKAALSSAPIACRSGYIINDYIIMLYNDYIMMTALRGVAEGRVERRPHRLLKRL